MAAPVVLVAARKRYRVRYLDDDEYDEEPLVVRRGRPRTPSRYRHQDSVASASQRGPVYVIRRRRPKDDLALDSRRTTVHFAEPEEPRVRSAEYSRGPAAGARASRFVFGGRELSPAERAQQKTAAR